MKTTTPTPGDASVHEADPEEVSLLRKWSPEALRGLPSRKIETLALSIARSLCVGRILLGRIMREIDADRISDFWGCNSGRHFGRLVLQLTEKQANDYCRVASALDELPLLSEAVEDGRIGWSKIREIVRKATPATEEFWIRMASTRDAAAIQRLVRKCPKGGLPGDQAEPETRRAERSKVQMDCDGDDTDLFQRGLVALSKRVGFSVNLLEANRYFFTELLLEDRNVTRDRFTEVLDALMQMRENGTVRDEHDQEDARREAEEMGLLDDAWTVVSEVDPRPIWVGVPGGPRWVGVPTAADLADAVSVAEPPDESPRAPWAAAAATEVPAPGTPDVLIVSPEKKPSWWGGVSIPKSRRQKSRTRYNPETRTVTPAQSDEIRRRDGFQCVVPLCRNFLWLHVHHIIWWCLGGLTLRWNLATVCRSCHQNIHDGWLTVEGDAEERLVFKDRFGRVLGARERLKPEDCEPLLPGEGGCGCEAC